MTTNQTSGGFIGDLAEAFAPPAAGGCCGAPASPSPASDTAQQADAVATACCGSTSAAQQAAQAGCCGQAPAPAVTPAAEAASTGCCG
ncbi:hypothetical protein [Nonomuraea bangladeshensis]|uniref:hypothetical protein n=1 Tax=Nonomuraea bangladeshensis TaxID=404385 RepID=UPI0031D62506